ncbi:PREDICTED: cysteine-rich receptor-like protein kinase 2 [Ipomoea nil]|uniref:cysteine-rich receptor-like protein kinase 2 n=1 Tax=Ipomoea nil TaxID=35883 RepID=UPI000900B983|nr:PREDICTED: cysteine-rich receptor-like protein kinase 2 [Ipomoea nil]
MVEGSGGRWRWLAVVIMVVSVSEPALSNPQTNQVGVLGCSPFNYTDVADSMRVLNATFADLRNQLSSDNKRFATSTQQPVYAMAQCRNYLSTADCVACLDAAVVATRNCSNKTGGRIIFDGCFLRYEDSYFYEQITDAGTYPTCGKRTDPKQDVFNTTAKQLLYELQLATPRINGFFAAAKQEASGGGGSGGAAFAVAQCIETIDETGCQACLTITYRNILGCLSKSASARAIAPACFMRYSNKRFFPNNQTTNLAAFLETGSSGKKKAIIGGVVGGVGIIILVLAAIFIYRRSKKPNAARRGNILGATQLKGPENYRYKDLKAATKGFSQENKLGQGGFGDVYKGTLKNGDVVAVKKLVISSRAKADFETEVRLITNVHHRNLIRLLGCSAKGEELLLVYEYMANASLDRYIYGDKRGMLNWKQRVDIILGTAMGLVYLHQQFHVCIIHRDIKSSNILLDDDFQPKIADFGLARLLPQNQSHVSTKFAGTLGYTAPEYAIHGHLSEKVDIYSFGIVILEIISGRRSSDIRVEPVTEYLLEQAWKLYENEEHLRLVDSTLDPNDYTTEEVKRILEIALVCTQSPPSLRPSMSELVIMLSSSDRSIFQNQPNRPTVISDLGNRVQVLSDTSATTASSTSHATASISDVSGR